MDQTSFAGDNLMDDDQMYTSGNLVDNRQHNSKDKHGTGLPNASTSLTKYQRKETKENIEGSVPNPKKTTVQRKGREKISACKAIQMIHFNPNVSIDASTPF